MTVKKKKKTVQSCPHAKDRNYKHPASALSHITTCSLFQIYATAAKQPQDTRKSNFLTIIEGGRSTSGQSSLPTHQGDITCRHNSIIPRRKLSKHITYTTHAPSRTPSLVSLLQHNTARSQHDGLNPGMVLIELAPTITRVGSTAAGRSSLTGGAGISSQLMGQASAGSVPSIRNQKKTLLPKAGSSDP